MATRKARADGAVTIAVPMLARIANFDDFDPLRMEPGVRLVFVRPGEPLPVADLVILPGSKATIADLAFLREQGWDIDILAHVRRGGRVLGVCGGYQMLGRRVADPEGVEGPPGAGRGPRPARRRDRADRRQDAARGRGRVPRERRAVSRLRNACRPNRQARIARGRCCASPTGGSMARCRRAAASPAPMCMGCSPTTASARRGSRSLGARSEIAYEATVERTLDDARRSSRGASRPRRDPQACAMSAAIGCLDAADLLIGLAAAQGSRPATISCLGSIDTNSSWWKLATLTI